ncbi:MAG: response regulator [Chitinivibrionales bacterium]|nr:response regulator [Chitinivibrionales bacterium]
MKKNVLIIHEDTILCERYVHRLRAENYTVAVAHTPQEGFKRVIKSRPDFIFLDELMAMGTEDFNIVDKLQHNKKTASIPIVLIKGLMRQSAIDIKKDVEDKGSRVIGEISVEESDSEVVNAIKGK